MISIIIMFFIVISVVIFLIIMSNKENKIRDNKREEFKDLYEYFVNKARNIKTTDEMRLFFKEIDIKKDEVLKFEFSDEFYALSRIKFFVLGRLIQIEGYNNSEEITNEN